MYKIKKIDCPAALGVKEKEDLVGELTKIARNAFGTKVTEEDVRNHIIPVSTMILAELIETGKTVGFATTSHYCFEDFSAIYLVGTCVLREYQGNGIFSDLLESAVEAECQKTQKPEIFVTRTQSPVLYAGIKKLIGDCQDERFRTVGENFAHMFGGELTEDFVMKKAYGLQMYDVIPRSKNEKDNELFDGLLDYKRGDAIVVVGKLKKI